MTGESDSGMLDPMRGIGFVPVLVLVSLGCGAGTPDGDDEVGETGTSSESESTETETGTSSESESESEESESESTETTETETSESESESTETGDEVPSCALAPGETLWSLPCDDCSRIEASAGLISLTLEGSQIPADIRVCGYFQFEGTVMDHPSPDVWVFDACPCDQDCEQPDPQTLDLSGLDGPDPGPHPAPELLPTELGECVRVDVLKSGSLAGLETLCRPEAVALWNLDGDTPVLSYAQGGSNDYEFPITLGELEIDAHDDCNLDNDTREFRSWSYEFTLGAASVDVPQQTSGMLMTATGDYRALNIAAQHWASVIEAGIDYYWWAVHPQR